MDAVLALRPFVPAQDFAQSRLFYEALGFRVTLEDASIAVMKTGSFSFILQKYAATASLENRMIQLLVRDVDAWWERVEAAALAAKFGVAPPRAPAMQPWGMKVGFLFDPSGVQWHVAEVPF